MNLSISITPTNHAPSEFNDVRLSSPALAPGSLELRTSAAHTPELIRRMVEQLVQSSLACTESRPGSTIPADRIASWIEAQPHAAPATPAASPGDLNAALLAELQNCMDVMQIYLGFSDREMHAEQAESLGEGLTLDAWRKAFKVAVRARSQS